MPTDTVTDDLATWQELSNVTEFSGLLVGNGASRAVWDGFHYSSLFDVALEKHRLTSDDVALFKALKTQNFEYVLAALITAGHVTDALGTTVPALDDRYSSIQKALVEAVQSIHVPWGRIPKACKETIQSELLNYRFVYSTNYDLIIYWAMMHENRKGLKDFFWGKYFDLANTELWGKSTGVLYLHGGLHLYRTVSGRTIKRQSAENENLLDLFAVPFTEDGGASPLFISEGSSDDKLASIARSDYLTFAYTTLAHHEGPLCIFGHSLDDMDRHIVRAIKQSGISEIAISIRPGTPDAVKSAKGTAISKLPSANLKFYKASTHPLGSATLRIEM
jgi:Domain of unknown function (DUF4917)